MFLIAIITGPEFEESTVAIAVASNLNEVWEFAEKYVNGKRIPGDYDDALVAYSIPTVSEFDDSQFVTGSWIVLVENIDNKWVLEKRTT